MKKDHSDDIVLEGLEFLIHYHMKAYQHNHANFTILKDPKTLDALYKIFKDNTSDDLSLMVSLFMIIMSISNSEWVKLKEAYIIGPTTRFIQKYIYETFQSKINEESNYDKNRLAKVEFIIKIFTFISEQYSRVYHIDLYQNYLNCVLLLYHINYPETRLHVLYILNHFSFYMDCKQIIIQNRRVVDTLISRINFLFDELQGMNNIYNDCYNTKEAINDLSRNKPFMTDEIFLDKEKNLQYSKMKSKFQDNINNFENSLNITKKIIIKFSRELGISISIFLNLMMMNEFQENLKQLCDDSFFNKKIKSIYEFFQNNMNQYKLEFDASGDLNKLIFQFLLTLMIYNQSYITEASVSKYFLTFRIYE